MDARDEAYDRLTGADPADGTTTREGVLRAKVDALTGGRTDDSPRETVPGTAAHATPTGTPAAPPDELAHRRRRRTAGLVAAAVAGAVVLGGGGYAVGAATADGAAPASDALPPVTLGGAGPQGANEMAPAPAPAGRVAADGLAAENSTVAGDSATSYDTAVPSWFDGRAAFSQEGLSTSGTEAAAYAYDATDVATKDGAARAAAALGVAGEPRWDWGSWSVGPQDGDGPTLWLSADSTAYLSYHDPAADPWRCETASAQELAEMEQPAIDGDQVCTEPEGNVSAKKAVAGLRDVMERLGVDPDGFEFEPSQDGEPGTRWVTAHEVVDGQRTGATWSATVSTEGIAWLDGFLAARTELGTYPVVSPAEAVERLGDPRFGQNLWPVTLGPTLETRFMVEPQDSGPTTPPAPPTAGDPLPWPVSDITITDARLGLAQEHRTDRATLLVPAYELSDADGNVWTVVAVADDALDLGSP
ncbi:hypothetical protein ATJ88_3157 [Isoptericola jiangsuensis]|uniref:Uncharacterized protein n=1 Tax=Isoptericola jiangsuensis TaxID=548579 RepID=A0A2A9F0C0_9MICO|nr:hypothetical protein [Isoptericola jiangsuensis]PFG44433.1 hypothetical protein ATJ88_3157 [Isoptericola jiangsuensis]